MHRTTWTNPYHNLNNSMWQFWQIHITARRKQCINFDKSILLLWEILNSTRALSDWRGKVMIGLGSTNNGSINFRRLTHCYILRQFFMRTSLTTIWWQLDGGLVTTWHQLNYCLMTAWHQLCAVLALAKRISFYCQNVLILPTFANFVQNMRRFGEIFLATFVKALKLASLVPTFSNHGLMQPWCSSSPDVGHPEMSPQSIDVVSTLQKCIWKQHGGFWRRTKFKPWQQRSKV